MDELPTPGTIPERILQRGLRLDEVRSLLQQHGASIRSVDNHHWQISLGDRSGLWMLGDAPDRAGCNLDGPALQRLEQVLRQTGLLRETPTRQQGRPMGAAILWVGSGSTRVYWINDLVLAKGSPLSVGHWLHGEFTLHRAQRSVPYLRRIVAMLERIDRVLLIGQRLQASEQSSPGARERSGGQADQQMVAGDGLALLMELLERLRPDLRQRVVGVLSLEADQLDDALLFTIARDYLLPSGGAPGARS
jgi:hypothetical protein